MKSEALRGAVVDADGVVARAREKLDERFDRFKGAHAEPRGNEGRVARGAQQPQPGVVAQGTPRFVRHEGARARGVHGRAQLVIAFDVEEGCVAGQQVAVVALDGVRLQFASKVVVDGQREVVGVQQASCQVDVRPAKPDDLRSGESGVRTEEEQRAPRDRGVREQLIEFVVGVDVAVLFGAVGGEAQAVEGIRAEMRAEGVQALVQGAEARDVVVDGGGCVRVRVQQGVEVGDGVVWGGVEHASLLALRPAKVASPTAEVIAPRGAARLAGRVVVEEVQGAFDVAAGEGAAEVFGEAVVGVRTWNIYNHCGASRAVTFHFDWSVTISLRFRRR